jgi:hypothetical protein
MTKCITYVIATIPPIFCGSSFAQSAECDDFGGQYVSSLPDGRTEMARIDCNGGWRTCTLHDRQEAHLGKITPSGNPNEWIVNGTIGQGLTITTSDNCKTLTWSNGGVWTKTH